MSKINDKNTNLDKALQAYKNALKINTIDKSPRDYAKIQNELGGAYVALSTINANVADSSNSNHSIYETKTKNLNLKNATNAYREALKIFTLKDYPFDYAKTKNNLGECYRELSELQDQESNLKKSIACFEEALKVFEIETYPKQHQEVKSNLNLAQLQHSQFESGSESSDGTIMHTRPLGGYQDVF
jgi:tetratricopeptide (TPR) repeat protein